MNFSLFNRAYLVFIKLPQWLKCFIVSVLNIFLAIRVKYIKTPTFIIFFVTNHCNAYCNHCFYRNKLKKTEPEMSIEEIRKIAFSLKHANELLITGGEPFLRSDLGQICHLFYTYGKTKKLRIATNGYHTSAILDVAKAILRDSKIDLTIQVSLDALGEAHDSQRNLPGLFNKATDTIAQLVALRSQFPRLKISVVATVSKDNYAGIYDLARYAKKYFGLPLDLSLVREPGIGLYNIDSSFRSEFSAIEDRYKLPEEGILRDLFHDDILDLSSRGVNIIRDFAQLEKQIELEVIFRAKKPFLKCLAGITDVVIYPQGEVALCEMTKPFAKLEDYGFDLAALWSSQQARQARSYIKHCFCAHPCHLISAMKNDARILLYMNKNKVCCEKS